MSKEKRLPEPVSKPGPIYLLDDMRAGLPIFTVTVGPGVACKTAPPGALRALTWRISRDAESPERARAAGARGGKAKQAKSKWKPEQTRARFLALHLKCPRVKVEDLASMLAGHLSREDDYLSVETIRRHTKALRRELKEKLGQ